MRGSSALTLVPVCAVVSLAFAGACASGGGARHPATGPAPAAAALDEGAAVHFLSRTSFGPTAATIAAVRRDGVARYLESQLHPERIDDGPMEARLAGFETLRLSSREIVEQYYQPVIDARRARQVAASNAAGGASAPAPSAEEQAAVRKQRRVLEELAEQKLLRAVYSDRQLQEVLVDFWFNHFNVFAGKGADRGLITAYERDVIRPHVFGTFRQLLGAVAESPAMLFYLDNWMSADPNGPHPVGRAAARRPVRPQQPKRRGLNENYARELMELHTLGVDGGYTQQDVVEVARCFTGWTITQPREGGGFRFDERLHDPGRKMVLGHEFKAGGGKADGDKVLDLLARHPATARFIAAKLVRRFVSDTPPPALVDRVAARFTETGGDLREVYRAILLSSEFSAPGARAAKVKSPFEFVASALRTTMAEVTDASAAVRQVRNLGMPPYGCQTPNGYGDTADAWVNTGALLNRMNVALALADGRLAGVTLDVAALAGTGDIATARPAIVSRLLDDRAAPATLNAIGKATTVRQVAALALGSPEFQRR